MRESCESWLSQRSEKWICHRSCVLLSWTAAVTAVEAAAKMHWLVSVRARTR